MNKITTNIHGSNVVNSAGGSMIAELHVRARGRSPIPKKMW